MCSPKSLQVAELTLLGEVADVEDEVAILELAGQHRRAEEVDLEVSQDQGRRDLEFLVQCKEAEVDFQEREQLGRDLAGDVEYRQRREEALRPQEP